MIDTERLHEFCRANAERICQHFFPQGKRVGHEWRIGDSSGKPGSSLGIELEGPKAGLAIDRAGGFDGDLIKLIGHSRNLTYPLVADEVGRTFGMSFQVGSQKPTIKPSRNGAFDWSSYVSNVTDADLDQLAKWRGYSPKFCLWLRDQKLIGRDERGQWAFPVQYNGKIVAAHVRLNESNEKGKHDWRYIPALGELGIKTQPLIIGKLAEAERVFDGESQWDLFSILDRLGVHEGEAIAGVATRGAGNPRLLSDVQGDIYLVPQNDEAGKKWLAGATETIGWAVKVLEVPTTYNDANDWLKACTDPQILCAAVQNAKTVGGGIGSTPFAAKLDQDFGDNGSGGSPPQLTDEELRELDKTALERYRLKDRPFPAPMAEEAFWGIAGDIVRIIEPESEASREAVLAQLLVAIGNRIGRGPHRKQGGIHHLNEFVVVVGETATGRKGTSLESINNLLSATDEGWLATRMRDGFQSGEAVIHAVRDAQYGTTPVNKRKAGEADKAEEILLDAGVTDKRLLIVEEEFGRLLVVASRSGNTLSSTLRKAWDAKRWLYTEGKVSPEKSTDSHISMIGHITADELLECMRDVDNKNGFSNRILFVASRRVKELPIPGWINWNLYPEITNHLEKVVETFGRLAPERELAWAEEAKREWAKFYKSARGNRSGILGSIIARSDAHVLRLSMLYAVLDNSALMKPEHLQAAIAFWQYCERSAQWVFGEKTGNRDADKIYWALLREPEGMTRTEISQDVFSKHATKNALDMAFSALVDAGLVQLKHECAEGTDKPRQRWFARKE